MDFIEEALKIINVSDVRVHRRHFCTSMHWGKSDISQILVVGKYVNFMRVPDEIVSQIVKKMSLDFYSVIHPGSEYLKFEDIHAPYSTDDVKMGFNLGNFVVYLANDGFLDMIKFEQVDGKYIKISGAIMNDRIANCVNSAIEKCGLKISVDYYSIPPQ